MFPRLKGRLRVQKKYFAFFAVVPLLLVSALIRLPCPVCGGTGTISSTGMGGVSVTALQATATGVYLAVCGTYRVYMTDVNITLQNDGQVDGNGYVSLILIDYKNGQVLDSQDVQVQVPANMQVNTAYTIFFQVNVDDPQTVKVNAKVVTGKVKDKACGGSGRVALNSYFVFDSMKERFMQAQLQSEVTPAFQPFFLRLPGRPGGGHAGLPG